MAGKHARSHAGTGAACLLAILGFLRTASAETETVSATAKAHFQAGVHHLRSQDPSRYARAYEEFKAAYADSPTWKILGNLGIVAQELERHGEAIDALERYLASGEAELTPEEIEQVRRDLSVLRSEQAAVTLEVPDGPFWVVDSRSMDARTTVVNHYGPFETRAELRVRAGKHRFEIERAAGDLPPWSIRLAPGASELHVFEDHAAKVEAVVAESKRAPAGAEEPSSGRTAAYVLWSIAGAAAATSAVAYLWALDVQTDADARFDQSCPFGANAAEPACPRTTPGDESAANWRTAAFISAGAAVATLITGTALYLTSSPQSSEPSGGRARSAVVSVNGIASPAWVGVSGSFLNNCIELKPI